MELVGNPNQLEFVFFRFAYSYAQTHGMDARMESTRVATFVTTRGHRFSLMLVQFDAHQWFIQSIGLNGADVSPVGFGEVCDEATLMSNLRFAMAALAKR